MAKLSEKLLGLAEVQAHLDDRTTLALLAAEAKRLERDAERYQWLRTNASMDDVSDERLAEMVARYRELVQIAHAPTTITTPPAIGQPYEGGIYAGLTVHENAVYHLILLPGDTSATLAKAGEWAKEQDGELPSRVDQLVLWENLRSKFTANWYWSSEPYAGDDAYAWCQNFGNGYQYDSRKDDELRARAVRRSSRCGLLLRGPGRGLHERGDDPAWDDELSMVLELIRRRAAEREAGEAAWLFTVRYIGKGKCSTFAALDYSAQEGEEIIGKQPLYTAPPALQAENERLRAALSKAADALYNGFEPDNQSRAYLAARRALGGG